jgi:TonB family protein
MEFVGLSLDQQGTIRNWIGETKAEAEIGVRPRLASEARKDPDRRGAGQGGMPLAVRKRRWKRWVFLLGLAAILVGVWWWRWNRGWAELESGFRVNETAEQPEARVPAEVMEKLVKHRVDPDYPAAARPGKLQGVVVIDVVVGSDGSVVDMHAVNGPEILAKAAMAALRWWRFEPYRVNGRPAVVETIVAVEFKP